MTRQSTRESVFVQAAVVAAGHECPYNTRLQRLKASLVTSVQLETLLKELEDIHTGGNCPPTHVNGSPTRSWSEWVDDTAV